MNLTKNAVVITEAPQLNYFHNSVCLPYDYGQTSYELRADVKAIKATVRKSLDDLDAATGWKEKFRGRKVLIKPNLVFVTPKTGYRYEYDVPNTTDPRVFDASWVAAPLPRLDLAGRIQAVKDVRFVAKFLI